MNDIPRSEYYRQQIASLPPLQQHMLALDVALTGNPDYEVVRQYHHYPRDIEKWMQEPGGNPVWYLSDSGYSRVVWNPYDEAVFLTYNSTSKVKARWDAAQPQRTALENYLKGEWKRLHDTLEARAERIVNRLLEADDDDVQRHIDALPERDVGLKSPVHPGDAFTAPMRIVLHKALNNDEWVTHMENMQVGGYVYGHYFRGDYAGAVADYRERCAKLGVDADASEDFLESVQEASSPKMKALKANRTELDDAERKEVMRRGAVWHHGKNGKPTPAVWKSEIRGRTYYVCNTHRAAQVKPTLKGAIRAFDFIKTTS